MPDEFVIGISKAPVANSVTTPAGVIRPTFSAAASVNQTFPSGPAVIPPSPALPVSPVVYSVTTAAGVILPILLGLAGSVNQVFPSAP